MDSYLAEPDQIGIRQEVADAVAYQHIVKAFLSHQLGHRLAVVAQIHKNNFLIGFCQETA